MEEDSETDEVVTLAESDTTDNPSVIKVLQGKRQGTAAAGEAPTKKRSLLEELEALTMPEFNDICENSKRLKDYLDRCISYAVDTEEPNETTQPPSPPEVPRPNINGGRAIASLLNTPATLFRTNTSQVSLENSPPGLDSQPSAKTTTHKQSFRLRNLTVVRNEDVPFLLGKAQVLHQLVGIAPLSRVGDMIFDAGKTHYWEFYQLCVSQAKPQFQRSRQNQVSYIFINWNIFFQPEDYDKTTLEKLLHSEVRRGDFSKGPSIRYPPKTYLSLIQFLPVGDLNKRSQRAEKQRRSASAHAEGARIGIDDLVLDNDMNRCLKSIEDAVRAVCEFILLATAPIQCDDEHTPVLHVMLVILLDFYEKRYKRAWEHNSKDSNIRIGSVILNAAMRCYHEIVEVSRAHLSLVIIQHENALAHSSEVLLGFQDALLEFRREIEQGERIDMPIPYGLSSIAKLEPDKPVHNATHCDNSLATTPTNRNASSTNVASKSNKPNRASKPFWYKIKVEGEKHREWGQIVTRAFQHLQGDKPCLNFLRVTGCTHKGCSLTHKEHADLDKAAQAAIRALAMAHPNRMQLLKSASN